MPGILPMKVIKVGTSSQARIAQACDRCRSKKIRCDGIRPSCTQCTSVGFECKTSDKLSRRAFPRGYTESLEERVRGLETETRELKDLLDAKDEKIDMLARMHSNSPHQTSSRRPSSVKSSPSLREAREALAQHESDDQFRVQQLPYLHEGHSSDPFFAATSSSRFFIDSFRRKLQEAGKSCPDLRMDVLLPCRPQRPATTNPSQSQSWQAPPRVVSDQMVNVFFQEWAPLFPILHRPTFLGIYEQYVASDGAIKDKKSLAQLNLVFSIAALSSKSRITYDVLACERQWVAALSTFSMEASLVNLQCLVLALISCLQKGDHIKVLHYRSLAIGICHRLGLHESQKRFALGTLSSETRKKVFWTLYTVDCFTAATLGLPRLFKEEDIDCEYPVDADDEYVTERGFQPSLPGESTKLSSALALFRGSRILAKILTQLYPSSATHDISLSTIGELDQELREWSEALPPHLRLKFENDKPSTDMISSRCPLLSLTYHYMRTLIHRPAACSDLGPQASSSVNALASSSKSIIQIIQLLDERNLGFSMCLDKTEVIMLAGFGTLFQILELPKESKLRSEYQRVSGDVLKLLAARGFAGAIDFRQVLACLDGNQVRHTSIIQSPLSASAGPDKQSLDARKALRDLARRYAAAAMPSPRLGNGNDKSQAGSASGKPPSQQQSREKRFRPIAPQASQRSSLRKTSQSPDTGDSTEPCTSRGSSNVHALNLDYFSFGDEASVTPQVNSTMQSTPSQEYHGAAWDHVFSVATGTGGNVSVTDGDVYGWPPLEDLLTQAGDDMFDKDTPANSDWITDASWINGAGDRRQQKAKSNLSFSEDTLSSGDEFAGLDFGALDGETAFKTLNMSSNEGSPEDLGLVSGL